MKKTFLVILALVMALTLVMGSVSTVSAAKPAPNPTLNLSGYVTQNHAGDWFIKYSFSWSDLAVTRYTFVVNGTSVSEDITFSRAKSRYSDKGSISIPNYGRYSMEITVYNGNEAVGQYICDAV